MQRVKNSPHGLSLKRPKEGGFIIHSEAGKVMRSTVKGWSTQLQTQIKSSPGDSLVLTRTLSVAEIIILNLVHIYSVQKSISISSDNLIYRYSEKAMATHSSTLAWKIPWTEEPRRLQSMGSQRVRHDWATSLSLFTFIHRRRKWQPTPVFLPGESQGRGSLVGCRLWGHTESDTTEATEQRQQQLLTDVALFPQH